MLAHLRGFFHGDDIYLNDYKLQLSVEVSPVELAYILNIDTRYAECYNFVTSTRLLELQLPYDCRDRFFFTNAPVYKFVPTEAVISNVKNILRNAD